MNPPDQSARVAALDLGRHILAVAPAGSGKTGLLVQRLLAALADADTPEQVVAITFTNKAAAEIRLRVMEALAAAQDPAPAEPHARGLHRLAQAVAARSAARGWNLQTQPDRLCAQTIDGFNAQIAAELPLLSGLGGRTQMTEDAQALFEEAVLALFDEALAEAPEQPLYQAAAAWLRAAGNRLDRLMPALCGLLARREQWAGALLGQTLGAEDDRRVLEPLHLAAQQRLQALLGDDAAELAALARLASSSSEAMAWAAGLDGWPEPQATQTPLYQQLAQLLITDKGILRKPNGLQAQHGFVAKSQAKARMQALLTARAGDTALAAAAADVCALPGLELPEALRELRDQLRVLLHRLLAHLRVVMGARGQTDFTEIAQAALGALRPDGGYGEALLRRDAQLRHLLVDEMQDTSEAQLRLLEQLTAGWQPGDGRSLFLVGDPQQSIYAFRKADVRLFQRLWDEQRLGELPLQRVQLTANFRSDPAVVEWFNTSFRSVFPTRPDAIAGEVPYTPCSAQRPAAGGSVTPHPFLDLESEAQAAAATTEQALQREGSVAILVRARHHASAVLRALRRRGIAYACQDVDALGALPAVRDLLACARALWHAEDRVAWTQWLRAPWVGLSWADLLALSAGCSRAPWPERLAQAGRAALSDEGRARVERLLAVLLPLQNDPLTRADLPLCVERLWTSLGGAACTRADELPDLRRALRLLREQAQNGGLQDEAGFARAVERLYAQPAGARVQVMTIHKAKGLEFDQVLLLGCGRAPPNDRGQLLATLDTPTGLLLVPRPPAHWPPQALQPAEALYRYVSARATAARRAESQRLIYVAATRARRHLDLFYTLRQPARGEPVPERWSFAALLWPVLEAAGAPAAAAPIQTTDEPANLQQAPTAPRLPLDASLPDEEPLYRPRGTRTYKPSEGLLAALEIKREDPDLYAQLVGTLLHQALEKIARIGIAAWQAVDREPALRAGLRRLGLPEPEVVPASRRILQLVARTLESPAGQFVLGPHPWAAAEYALAGYRDGDWVSAVIDRCFETRDGRLWVVDYKSAARPVAAAQLDDYRRALCSRYAAQITQYAELLQAHRGAGPCTAALYVVETGELLDAGGQPLAPG
jgi:ATP-dependent helicase/nuclease subunit A